MRVIVLLVVLIISASAKKSYEGYKVYRLTPETELQIKLLDTLQNTPNFDFWSRLPAKPKTNHVDVMVTPRNIFLFEKFLKGLSIPYLVLINDVEKSVSEERFRQTAPKQASSDNKKISFTKYYRYDEIQEHLNQLKADYPNIVSLENIGKSYENRDLTILKISTGGNGTKPVILIDGGIHAREWIAPAQVLYIISQLLENESNKNMIDNIDWYFFPVFNPDGYEYTHTHDRFWRKTRSPGSSCDGVDANRNFGFHWMEGGASSFECSETYAGPKAFSESETTALSNFIKKHPEQIKLYLTFHSYGQYILYPWGYTPNLPEDVNELDSLGRKVKEAIYNVDGTRYEVGSSTNVLYIAAGGSDDWAKGVGGVQLSYTIELPGGGSGGFDLPASRILPVCIETFEGVKVYYEHIENKFVNKKQ